MLIKEGVDVNIKDNYDMTALLSAAVNGKIDAVALLIENKSDINSKDDAGFKALIRAAARGHADTVSMLIDKSADVNIRYNNDKAALKLAQETDYMKAASLISKYTQE